MSHDHQLVLIREFSGDHKVYWCRECGLIMEMFGDKFAEMLPEWSHDRLLKEDRSKEKFLHAEYKLPRRDKRLGKGLRDLSLVVKAPAYLQKFLSKE